MLRLYADFFVEALFEMHELEAKWIPNDVLIPEPSAVAGKLSALQLACAEHGLKITEQKCVRIMEKCTTNPVTYRAIVGDLKELRERLEDELRSHVFFHLTPQEAEIYEKPVLHWNTVITRFPKTKTDIEDSSKCFAFGMYAAAVFHILLVAEYGIVELGKLFLPAGGRPGWGDLERLEKISDKKFEDKTPFEKKHSNFLKSLMPLAFGIKDAWRHKLSHVDNKIVWVETDFSARTADEIITTTRGFMRGLAKDLPA